MATIPLQVSTWRHREPATQSDLSTDLHRARTLAKLLDSQFSLGKIKFGIDPIADLFPVVGDTAMLLVGLYPIYIARKHGLGKSVERRMVLNLAVEWLGGIFPVVGSLFDMAFKANLRNVALLERAAGGSGL